MTWVPSLIFKGSLSLSSTLNSKYIFLYLQAPEYYKNIDVNMITTIKNEILTDGTNVEWDDICGLDSVKQTIQEAVIFPMIRQVFNQKGHSFCPPTPHRKLVCRLESWAYLSK